MEYKFQFISRHRTWPRAAKAVHPPLHVTTTNDTEWLMFLSYFFNVAEDIGKNYSFDPKIILCNIVMNM